VLEFLARVFANIARMGRISLHARPVISLDNAQCGPHGNDPEPEPFRDVNARREMFEQVSSDSEHTRNTRPP
jgi:hypothetical protein